MKKSNVFFYLIIIFISSCGTKIFNPKFVGLSKDSLKIATQNLHKYVDKGALPGTFVRIIKNGKVVYNDKYGFVDVAKKKPVKNNSLYRIFSMTKPITAVAIMVLYDQGKLSLDDNISKYIPEFSNVKVYKNVNGFHSSEDIKNPITIRHLLTHTSGIPYGWGWSHIDSIYNSKQHMRKDWTIGEMSKDIATIPLKFQPGSKYNYGLGIDVAGYIVEVVSGKKLDYFFKTFIFEPLEMKDTGFYVPKQKSGRLSQLYTHDENKNLIIMDDPDIKIKVGADKPPKLLLGGAGLVSTMKDYENFCNMLLNKGKFKNKRVLSENAAKTVITNQLPDEIKMYSNFGHGLSGIVDINSGEYNWSGAASTSFWINPSKKQIIICYTQLFSSPTEYAKEFKASVDNALINQKITSKK